MPHFHYETIELSENNLRLRDIIVSNGKLSSQKEAKRIIQQGGLYVDEQRIDDINHMINFNQKDEFKIRIGGHRVYFLKLKKGGMNDKR